MFLRYAFYRRQKGSANHLRILLSLFQVSQKAKAKSFFNVLSLFGQR